MPATMELAQTIAKQAKPEYKWLQVATVDHSRSLPWVCVDCRTGTIHTFKTSDDARYFADQEKIAFYL